MSTVIKIENVSKLYRLGKFGTGTLVDDFNRWWHLVRGKEDPYLKIGQENDRTKKAKSDFVWSLRDISFDVNHGDVVGVVGRNGAGKSTLLKIISRTTSPTIGSIKIKGRISSLLEVGTGFNPELSGRENVYLNGSILGMTKKEIDRKFDEILDFSGVEAYIDTPTKRYSSGMKVRLAFAVAAHLEPEIMIIDEVLAVGDAEFQKKCLGKMSEVSQSQGRTILFVSHNIGAVKRLCNKGIMLQNGKLAGDGNIDEIIELYTKLDDFSKTRKAVFTPDINKEITIKEVSIYAEGKSEDRTLDMSDRIIVQVKYIVNIDTKGTNISFTLTKNGIILFRSWDIDLNQELFQIRTKGEYTAKFALPDFLTNGSYTINIAAGKSKVGIIESHEDCIAFDIENNMTDGTHHSFTRGGLIKSNIIWDTVKIN